MSLHLSPLFGPFVTLFFEKNENFLFRSSNRFVDALKTDAFLFCNLTHGHSPNMEHPKPTELRLAQFAFDLSHQVSVVLHFFQPVMLCFQHGVHTMYGYGVCAKFFHRHRVIVLKVVALFSIVVIRIRPSFPVLEFFLTGKVLTGQADDMLVGIYVNDGGRVFLFNA